MDVAELSFLDVPAELRQHSYKIEVIEGNASEILEVPAILGWAVHAGVRLDETPLNTHVCSSSYDHISIDVAPERVRSIYEEYPQLDMLVSLAGLPGQLTVNEMKQRFAQWAAPSPNPVGTIPAAKVSDVYCAAPVFMLHRVGESATPIAACACRFRLSNGDATTISVEATLDWVATAPEFRNQGLAHLILLEASRWLAMLTRSIKIRDKGRHTLIQRIVSSPRTKSEYHFAQVFFSNFSYFCVTEELVENTRKERDEGNVTPGSVRSGLGTLMAYTPLEDAIYIPDEVLYLQDSRDGGFVPLPCVEI